MEGSMMNLFRNHSSKHWIFLSFITFYIVCIVLLITRGHYLFGSVTDWTSQHAMIPDYFRQHFYQTGELLPQFQMNLGAGQNAFYLSYYGYLNPITLVSYLFPHVSMVTYVMVSSVIFVLVSVYLFFFWLYSVQKSDADPLSGNDTVLYVTTFLFANAAPLLFHSHKQIMFISYMPFLILALMGVDRLFAKKKRGLLIVSVALLFFTSYFFAVTGLFVLSVYGIYRYLCTTGKPSVRSFFVSAGSFLFCALTGICISASLIVPSLLAILNSSSRSSSGRTSLWSLLIPTFPLTNLNYIAYGIGLSAIAFIALFAGIIQKKNLAKRFLAITILIVLCFPLISSLLSGFLYTRGKVLIPFLPLVLLLTAGFFQEIHNMVYAKKCILIASVFILACAFISAYFRKKLPVAFLFCCDFLLCLLFIFLSQRKKNKKWIYVPVCIVSAVICIGNNFYDVLLPKRDAKRIYSTEKASLMNQLQTQDTSFYRTYDICDPKLSANRIYGANYHTTSLYSSIYNKNYLQFCNHDISISLPSINDISVTSCNNILFQTLMGCKYLISNSHAPAGYQQIDHNGSFALYQNTEVNSLGFASEKLMSLREFSSLDPADRSVALLNHIVVDQDLPDVYQSELEEVPMQMDFDLPKNADGYLTTDPQKNNGKVYHFTTPDNLKDYVYIISCDLKKREPKECTILINGIQNSLSGYDATLPNQNYHFQFVVSSNTDLHSLSVELRSKNTFQFSDMKIYRISYEKVKQLRREMTQMSNVHYNNCNVITGHIQMKKNGYCTTTIPYDKGFSLTVDGKAAKVEMTDHAFVGFALAPRSHEIRLTYQAPGSAAGRILSTLGLCLLAGTLICQKIRKKLPITKNL